MPVQVNYMYSAIHIVLIIRVLCVQVKDLRERIEEAESMGVRKMKAQLHSMESRVASLEEQLDTATRSATSTLTLVHQPTNLVIYRLYPVISGFNY